MKRKALFAVCLFLVCLVFLVILRTGKSQILPVLTLDGRFEDWQGQAYLANELVTGGPGKLQAVFWGDNGNQPWLYFMVERQTTADPKSMALRLFLDINGNGAYGDSVDKLAEVIYNPRREQEKVQVQLFSANGLTLATYQGGWGEGLGAEGRRLEFALPMSKLGVLPGQPIRFYLAGMDDSIVRLPAEGDIMWTPFPVITRGRVWLAAFFLVWASVLLFLRLHRIWVFYYFWGAVGLTFLLLLFLRGSSMEFWLERQVALLLHDLLFYLGIKTSVFDKTPGTLLVLNQVEKSWTTMEIDIESSGLLEMCIFLGLLLFYPAYTIAKKILYALTGMLAVFAINLINLLVIVITIHNWGRNVTYIAHTLVGRLVFFLLILALYWQIFTIPSLQKTRERLKNA